MPDDLSLPQQATHAIMTQPSAQQNALDALLSAFTAVPSDAEKISVSGVWNGVNTLLSYLGLGDDAANVQDKPVVTQDELEKKFHEAINDLKLALGPGEDGQGANPHVGFANLWNIVYALIAHYKVELPDYLMKQPKDKKEAAQKGLNADKKLALVLKELAPLYRRPSLVDGEDNSFHGLVEVLEELARKAASVPAYWKTDLEQLGTILAGQKVNGFWNTLFNGSAIDQMKVAQNELIAIRDGTRLSWVLMVIQGWQEKQSLAEAKNLTHVAQTAAAVAVKSAAEAAVTVDQKIQEASDAISKAETAEQRAAQALSAVESAEKQLSVTLVKAQLAEEHLAETREDLKKVAQKAYQDQQEKEALQRREDALLARAEALANELTEVKTLYAQSQAGSRAASQAGSLVESAYNPTTTLINFLTDEAAWDSVRIFIAKQFKTAFCPRQTFFADEAGAPSEKKWNIELIPAALHEIYRAVVLCTTETSLATLVEQMVVAITRLMPTPGEAVDENDSSTTNGEDTLRLKRIKGLAKSLVKLRTQFRNGTKVAAERQQSTDAETTLQQRAIHARMFMLIGNDMRNPRVGLFPMDLDGLAMLDEQLRKMGGEPAGEELQLLPEEMRNWFSYTPAAPNLSM